MNIIQPAAQKSLTVAGRTFTDLANLIVLGIHCVAPGAGRYSTFRLPSAPGGTGYQVPVGKVLKIRAMQIIQISGIGAGSNTYFGYADNDVGPSSATIPTNLIWPHGNQTAGLQVAPNITHTADNPRLEAPFTFDIPAGKYAFVYAETTYSIVAFLYGELENA